MKLSFVEKLKIGKMIRETTISELNYHNFYDVSNKKCKYNDIDILEYLLDFVYDEISKNKIFNLNYILKYIYSIKMFLTNVIDNNGQDKIAEEYHNKLIVLKKKYDEIRSNYSDALNNKVDSELEQIKKILESTSYQVCEQTALETIEKGTKEKHLKKEIDKLYAEINHLKKQNDLLHKKIDKDVKSNTNQAQIINLNNQKIKILETEICKLKTDYELLSSKYIDLKDNYEKATIESDAKSAEIKMLEETIKRQQEKLVIYEMDERNRGILLEKKENTENLANIIFKIILHREMNIFEIFEELKKQNEDVNLEDVKKALLYLETKVKITNDKIITIPRLYKIENAKTFTNSNLFLNSKPNSYIDLLSISDLHVKTLDEKICSEIEKVYNYCEKEKVDIILNLGDFFGLKHPLNDLVESEKILDIFNRNLPDTNNITHAILGGNHDEFASAGSFNVLEKLCALKDGYIYLGDEHANINFDSNNRNFFTVHHINKKIETDFISLFPDSKAYVNLIGHTHISKFDLCNNNIFVPSLIKDRMSNGALRVRIYFDEKNNIDYMLFTLLKNEETGLIPVTEIPYRRSLKNKL